MEEKNYRTIYKEGIGEIVEKKSRFIATVVPVETEKEALAFIAKMKKQYWEARHNCYAYVIGDGQELQRCSDDGEPSGTAGRPMLEILLREGIHNVAVVVTRYFGGVLLGTGGLVRAYQKAVQEGLAKSEMITKSAGVFGTVQTDYHGVGKVQYILGQNEIAVADSIYTEKVEIQIVVPTEKREVIEKELMEETGGKIEITWDKEVFFAIIDKKLKIF
ncbi:MAG: YigZ family protein [Lachnospiraceae bacterium]|nr:YigZ family protein [Lachnospiraceae bacterium]